MLYILFQHSAKMAVEMAEPASLPMSVPVHRGSQGLAVKLVRNPLLYFLCESYFFTE